jgi:type I restriction enzyme S subunit
MFGDLKANGYGWEIKPFNDNGFPFYRVRDMVVLAENGNANNEFFVSEDFYNALSDSDGLPSEGDIMVSATSTIGKCYVVKSDEKFYYKDADVLRFRTKIELSPLYFIHCLRTPYVREQIDASLGVTTVGHFTIVNAKKIKLPLPPLELQTRFADFVRAADKSKFTALKQAQISFLMYNNLYGG